MSKKADVTPETKNAQALGQVDAATGGITPVIQPSTTFCRDDDYNLVDAKRGYGRADNPGFGVAENVIADLEGGAEALLFSSGMSAAMAIVQTLKPGDHIAAPRVMYWGLRKWLLHFCDRWGFATRPVRFCRSGIAGEHRCSRQDEARLGGVTHKPDVGCHRHCVCSARCTQR